MEVDSINVLMSPAHMGDSSMGKGGLYTALHGDLAASAAAVGGRIYLSNKFNVYSMLYRQI